ncbi:MAG: hypothetical protein MMC23_006442 [Stictis urceolatum]|nr:hypothetical protein [Stictis urceolata]
MGFGSNNQYVNVLISTSSNVPWTVVPQGCTRLEPTDCAKARGGLFERNSSTTWKDVGQYSLSFEENLGYTGTGLYGYDSLSLGLPGSGAPVLNHQLIAGIRAEDFWVASWGIRPAPLNFTTISDPDKSLVSTLKDNDYIPSLTWGYTAGSYAHYQDSKSGLGSLTLGGFDASRFEPHDTKFTFGPDISRDLLLGIQSITVAGDAIPRTDLLPSPVLSFVDAGTPHIWLPKEACDKFARILSLSYNEGMDLYLMNTTQYKQLKARNLNINFTLGSDKTGGPTVALSFPFSAFDLELNTDYPGVDNSTRYFPLRRAANETQYTLGRAFLQHAYVIADYESNEFSVHQALFPDSQQQNLQAIYPASNGTPSTGGQETPHKLATSTIVGIVIAVVAILLLIGSGALTFYKGRRNRANQRNIGYPNAVEVPANEKPELASHVPTYKKVLGGMGFSMGRGMEKRTLINEMEQSPVELEVPKVNHEVAARERSVGDDRDSWDTDAGVWRESRNGGWIKRSGDLQEVGARQEVHELP